MNSIVELQNFNIELVSGGFWNVIRAVVCTTGCIILHLGGDERQQDAVMKCAKACMGEG